MFDFLNNIKEKIIDWCLSKETISVGELHQKLNPQKTEIYDEDTNELKFIEKTSPEDLFVKSSIGYSRIKHTFKTVPYVAYRLTTENHELICADEHLVINDIGLEQTVRTLVPNQSRIITESGFEKVLSVEKLDFEDNMFDLELDDNIHLYYTNGILSHNSATSCAYLLWYATFNFDKTVLIASNKNFSAMEMISRIQYMYENVPMWLKAGVVEGGWNKHEIKFDNKSQILSTATSEDAGRGLSISKLFLDEFAFVKPTIQDEFYTAILPTLSTGGSMIITSTPNGDSNLFAELWRGAVLKTNGFYPVEIPWNAPPGRDEKFKEEMIAKLGMRRWQQEYECRFISSEALLIDTLVATRIYNQLKEKEPLRVVNGFEFYQEILDGNTYFVGVDPATGGGDDYTVITVYEYPSLEQVVQYRSNTMSLNEIYKNLKEFLTYLESKNCEVYFSIENNGVGQGLISLYYADSNPPNSEFVSEKGKEGFTTTSRTKMRTCMILKELIEKDIMHINSLTLAEELKAYVRHKGAYAAQPGATDDCISATLIVIRILDETFGIGGYVNEIMFEEEKEEKFDKVENTFIEYEHKLKNNNADDDFDESDYDDFVPLA